jgi:hypothetical protein
MVTKEIIRTIILKTNSSRVHGKYFIPLIRGYRKSIAEQVKVHFPEIQKELGTKGADDYYFDFFHKSYTFEAISKAERRNFSTIEPLADLDVPVDLPINVLTRYIEFAESIYDVVLPTNDTILYRAQKLTKALVDILHEKKNSWEQFNRRCFEHSFRTYSPLLPIYIFFVVNDVYPLSYIEYRLEKHTYSVANIEEVIDIAFHRFVEFHIFEECLEQKKHIANRINTDKYTRSRSLKSIDSWSRFQHIMIMYLFEHNQLFEGHETEFDKSIATAGLIVYVKQFMTTSKLSDSHLVQWLSVMKYLKIQDVQTRFSKSGKRICSTLS